MSRMKIAGRLPGASLAFAMVNTSTNPGLTPAVLTAIAVACETQLNAEFAAEWGGRYIVRVAPDKAHVTPDETLVALEDTLPVKGALGYHDTLLQNGKPIAYIACAGITNLTADENALSTTISHELLETAADPAVNRWESRADGTLIALEVCDEVEDTGYMGANGVFVSNFLFQSYFAPGSIGPYDQLGILTAQGQETAGGYTILGYGPSSVITARTRFDELKEHAHDLGAATHGRHEVVYVSKRPRAAVFERKNHPASRTHRRGIRFGWHTPVNERPVPLKPLKAPPPGLAPAPAVLRRG